MSEPTPNHEPSDESPEIVRQVPDKNFQTEGPPEEPFQFRISDLLFLMFGVALGLSGGTWIPAGMFALIVGILALAAPFVLEIYEFDQRDIRVAWTTLIISYWLALVVATLRG